MRKTLQILVELCIGQSKCVRRVPAKCFYTVKSCPYREKLSQGRTISRCIMLDFLVASAASVSLSLNASIQNDFKKSDRDYDGDGKSEMCSN